MMGDVNPFVVSGVFAASNTLSPLFRTVPMPVFTAVCAHRWVAIPYHWLSSPAADETALQSNTWVQVTNNVNHCFNSAFSNTFNHVHSQYQSHLHNNSLRWITDQNDVPSTATQVTRNGAAISVFKRSFAQRLLGSVIQIASPDYRGGPADRNQFMRQGNVCAVTTPSQVIAQAMLQKSTAMISPESQSADGSAGGSVNRPASERKMLQQQIQQQQIQRLIESMTIRYTATEQQASETLEKMAAEKKSTAQFTELKQQLKQVETRSDQTLQRLNQSLQEVKQMLSMQGQLMALPMAKAPSYYGRLK